MSGYVTGARLAQIERELTERDRAVVGMLAAVKLATGDQLRRATVAENSENARRAARRQLARLVRWRVVARLERRLGGLGRGSDSWSYALDVAGQRLAALGGKRRRPRLPGRPMWAHVLVGAEIYARLHEDLRGTDRSVRLWQGEPDCWRDFGGGYGERLTLKPDGYVVVAGGGFEDASFLEIDMGTQSPAVIRGKLAAYRRYAASGQEGEVFPLVVFVTTSLARHGVLVDLIGGLPTEAWRLFGVGLASDAARLLTGGAS